MASRRHRPAGDGVVIRRVLLAASLLAPLAAAAQSPLPEARDVLVLEGMQVPLPAGPWLPVGDGEPAAGVRSVALLQAHAGRVTGGVLVQVSRPGGDSAAWGTAPACTRSDLPFARVRYASGHDGSCAWVAVAEAADGADAADPAWAAARTFARVQGWTFPERWGTAGVRVSDPVAAVQVRYAVPLNADAPLPPGIAGWAEAAWDRVERGTLNQLDAALPLPALVMVEVPGAVSDDPQGGIPRAVWKTLTFRGIVTTIDFTANVIILSDLVTATLLSAWATVTGPWLYLAHELAWDYFSAPPGRRLDLPGIGTERAGP